MQKVQDIMLAEVQGMVQGGAGRCREVQGGARAVHGWLHHLHLGKHNIRCKEVQAVQAHLNSGQGLPIDLLCLAMSSQAKFGSSRMF